MNAPALVDELRSASRSFGSGPATRKLSLLRRLESVRISRPAARDLGGVLNFMRAYADDASVLRAVDRLAQRLPDEATAYPFSYGVLQQLVRARPGVFAIDWEAFEEQDALIELLTELLLPGESQVLEDDQLGWDEWFQRNAAAEQTDLEFLLKLMEGSSLPDGARVSLFERCNLRIPYRGLAAPRDTLATGRIHYQRKEIDRSRFPLAPIVRRKPVAIRKGGRNLIDLSLRALCARDLEIHSLIYANPNDVWRAAGSHGLEFIFIGTLPEWRSPLESLFFFLVLKNGVPLGYGPTAVCLGFTEMGINLFPEFRGCEVRQVYVQLMRMLHHHFGVGYFFLTRYAMGIDNEHAIRSGAFWFYRKLGFRPTNQAVEDLAREEEDKMAKDRGYRSDRKMLRRLARTEAYLDLSGGRIRPVNLGTLGLLQGDLIKREFGGNRRKTENVCSRRLGRWLGVDPQEPGLRALAPLLCLLPGIRAWPSREASRLRTYLLAKGRLSERKAAALSGRLDHLREGLVDLASQPHGQPASGA